MWHAEISSLVLRHYDGESGYELHLEFNGVAFAKTMGHGIVFIEGALRISGKPFTMCDWKELGACLLEQFGIHTIKADRRGREVTFDVKKILRIK